MIEGGCLSNSRQQKFSLFLLKSRNISYRVCVKTAVTPQIMKGYLGEFEELVLLTIVILHDEAYGVSIQQDIEKRSDRNISIGALHSTLTRLEEKGFLKSHMGDPSQERGGRRKRFFEVTHRGKIALNHMKALRDELWNLSKAKLSLK